MKKFLMMIAVAMVSLSAAAQTWYAGGSFGIYRNIDKNYTEISVQPELGYNINANWSVGATVDIAHQYQNDFTLNSFGIAPYLRYTFFTADKVSLFCDGGFGFYFKKPDYEGAKTASTSEIGFRPGVAFNITKKFSVVAHVGFLGYQGHNKYSDASECANLGVDLNDLSLGFYYNF